MEKGATLEIIKDLIIKRGGNYNIEESQHGAITKYSVTNGTEEVCEITLSTGNYKIAHYSEDDRWFGDSWHKQRKAISVMFLRSNVKGMGKLMLSYGVLAMWTKKPGIKYCVLDDDSDNSVYKDKNIYSALSFTPTNKATDKSNEEGPDRVQLNGPEKQCLLSDFLSSVKNIANFLKNPELPEPSIKIWRRESDRIKHKSSESSTNSATNSTNSATNSRKSATNSRNSARNSRNSARNSATNSATNSARKTAKRSKRNSTNSRNSKKSRS